MTCDICKKNDSDLVIQTMMNGEMTERHLCFDCAKRSQLAFAQAFLSLGIGLGRPSTGDGVLDASPKPIAPTKVCSHCGAAYDNLSADTILSCPQCYEAFSEELVRLRAPAETKTKDGEKPAPPSGKDA